MEPPPQCFPAWLDERQVLIGRLRKQLDLAYRCAMFTAASSYADQILDLLEPHHVRSDAAETVKPA